MAYSWMSGTIVGLFNAVFRPSVFVSGRAAAGERTRLFVLRRVASLAVVYVVNLALYATPLTLTGFGVNQEATPPAWFAESAVASFGNPAAVWRFLTGFAQNSAFLLVATVLTLVTFHASVVLARSSKGILQTVYTVVYSTSAYLAGIFTVVWYLSTNEGVTAARELVIAAQKAFIYYFIDLTGSSLGLPGGRPDAVDPGALSSDGTTIIALLAVMGLYYLYSLYLGTRINHRAGRFTGVLVVSFVAASPAIYVLGLIAVSAGGPPA
jgi:hypothetical protein